MRKIYGVGTNRKVGFLAKTKGKNTLVYDLWRDMLRRCYCTQSQLREPTYVGCTVAPEFWEFQEFATWASQQVGFGLPNYHMDKDLILTGNRVYCKYLCVFVPFDLNMFTTSSLAKRGVWPQGVSWKTRNKKFVAQMKYQSKVQHLGLFSDLESAMHAYAKAKTSAAQDWARRLRLGEFVVDARVIESLETYKFNYEGFL